jgi:hypothetical protein
MRPTISDIAHRALEGVRSDERERIFVALENAAATVPVDGDRLASSLGRLVEHAVRGNCPDILLRANHDAGGTSFSVVSRESERTARASDAFGNTWLSRAIRDVLDVGGALSIEHTPAGHLQATIHIPATSNGSPLSPGGRR